MPTSSRRPRSTRNKKNNPKYKDKNVSSTLTSSEDPPQQAVTLTIKENPPDIIEEQSNSSTRDQEFVAPTFKENPPDVGEKGQPISDVDANIPFRLDKYCCHIFEDEFYARASIRRIISLDSGRTHCILYVLFDFQKDMDLAYKIRLEDLPKFKFYKAALVDYISSLSRQAIVHKLKSKSMGGFLEREVGDVDYCLTMQANRNPLLARRRIK